MKRYAVIALLTLGCTVTDVVAQYPSEKEAAVPLENYYVKRNGIGGFRRVLSKLTFGLSTGYGGTTFSHELEGFDILQNPGQRPVLLQPNAAVPGTGYTHWVNRVESDETTAQTGASRISSDDGMIGFESKSFHIPLKATVHVEFNRYRIGGGYSFEYTRVGDFQPLTNGDVINSFTPDVSAFFLKKYFGMIGASVYRYYEYLLIVDANIGGYSLGKKFDKSVIDKGMFMNFGVAVEREMSEYFRLFVRPSYEVRGFDINIPEGGQTITHKFNAFYVNIGATYRIPELRRCFLKTCRAQMHHAHGNREYRSRAHPFYKKQNPHYGENHPTLIKYKGKNKKKLNPY